MRKGFLKDVLPFCNMQRWEKEIYQNRKRIERIMSEIYFLPAQQGDAFFLHCQKGNEEGWIVVDGGPLKNKNKSVFLKKIENLPQIDLMVLTHHDKDHICGILAYVNEHKSDNPFPVNKLWVNCARQMDIAQGGNLSAPQASDLADALAEIQKTNPIIWKDKIVEGMDTSDIKFADIDVLSPNDDLLEAFIKRYEKKASEKKQEHPMKAGIEDDDLDVDLDVLATREKKKPNESNYQVMANMASIAFVVQCDGFSALMLGDSFPQQIEAALTARKYSKENKLKIDFVKVAHHGSLHNISNDLLDMIDCNNFLISTDGGQGETNHPTREALANIICHPQRDYSKTLHLHFNYTLSSIAFNNGFKLFNDGEEVKYNFRIHEPDDNIEGCHYRATRY